MKKISRRQFISSGAAVLATTLPCRNFLPPAVKPCDAALSEDIRGKVFKGDAPQKLWKWSREGFLYKKLGKNKVVCGICPNRCVLSPGDRSVCRSKINKDGTLYSLTYGNPCSVNTDPIEKKPLFHFKPRTKAFSIATTGCNFRCLNCQNYEISQAKPHEVWNHELFPADAVKEAQRAAAASIAYTYSEPITFFEYMIDTSRIAKENGIHNVWVSNAFINRKPLIEFCKVLDGASLNFKSYSDDIYRKLNGGRLKPVLNTFKILHEQNIHFEMINLAVPVHFLRFFPRYKLDRLAPTPVSTLTRFRKLAMQEGIHYVYVGNVANHEGTHTFCHNCKKRLIARMGYFIPEYNLNGNQCKFCNTVIPGIWHEKVA